MLKTLLIVFTLFLFKQNFLAQTGNFFPIAIGNEYQFNNGSNNYWFGTIERDTVYPNEHRYFSLPYFFEFGDSRVDENGNVLSASKPFFIDGDPEEYLLFKADAELDEVWAVAWNYNVVIDTGYARCFFDDSLFLFGELRRVKGILLFDESYYYYYFWLAEGLGLLRNQYDDGSYLYLNYAKIDGAVFGTVVSVEEENNSIPIELVVSQNYPNPFNGITNIDIHLPSYSGRQTIKLNIYNILGVKVYEREYDVNNYITVKVNTDLLNLSSGTYFYSVIYENKQITRKFLLIK